MSCDSLHCMIFLLAILSVQSILLNCLFEGKTHQEGFSFHFTTGDILELQRPRVLKIDFFRHVNYTC